MWLWLKKLFKKKDEQLDMENIDNVNDEVMSIISQNSQPKKRKHKLEIQLFEADYENVPDGAPPKWRPVNMGKDSGKPIIVEVANKQELVDLQQRYALCDQKMKIIREIDPFDDNDNESVKSSKIPQNNQAIPVCANALMSEKNNSSIQHNPPVQNQSVESYPSVVQKPSTIQVAISRPKPKIVTIGDMQVKYDGDKVYQRQWVKLNSNEASNFRVVNDSNNKIISMNGKHIECKKWVIVEEDDVSENDDVMNLISGE